MSNVTRRGPVKPQLNITPLIDVVFLLIVFFMIVNNIVTDEVPEVQLPDLTDPEVSVAEGQKRVIINLVPKFPYEPQDDARMGPGHPIPHVLGRRGDLEQVTLGKYKWDVTDENFAEDFIKTASETIRARTSSKGEAPLILLRVDAAIYYGQVLPVMNALQMAMSKGLDAEVAANTPIHLVAYLED